MTSHTNRLPRQLGAAVRELRLEAGMCQMALAEKSGLTLTYVGNVERGESLASIETVVRLASALGIKGSELMARARL